MNTHADLGGQEQPAPPLRDDLRLDAVAPGRDGEPAWVIQDTVLNRFFRIGWLEFEMLLRWGQPPTEICRQITQATALRPHVSQVTAFRRFLAEQGLLRPTAESLARLRAQGEAGKWLAWRWWLHHYLFFRIPLLRPQRLLAGLARRLAWLFHPASAVVIAVLGIACIVLVLQQWDTYTADIVDAFSMEGLLSFALALITAKLVHELAHALVATRLGLKVAHMGVAFVVLWPMLYTDTGESWKLRSARQRLAIASAGILSELALAGLATLGWALSDPGAQRNALLYLATTSWLLSLGLNASPFMRFDGYFILSDLLDFPNLHQRSSALARIAMRRTILGLDEPWSEPLPTARRRLLVAFAFTTWLYRLVVFLGIAIAVYLFFFKLLGLLLFVDEVGWFIVLPVWRELKHGWADRARVPCARRLLLGGMVVLALLAFGLPWRAQIAAEGVARAEHQLRVFIPFPARVASIRPSGKVGANDTLLVMEEPDILLHIRGSEAGIRGYEGRLAGLIADAAGLEQQNATRERLRVQYEQAASDRSDITRLSMAAPYEGLWTDVDPQIRRGLWINPQEQVGMLIDPDRWQVDAYVGHDDIQRIAVGDKARFYPVGQWRPIEGHVVAVGSTRTRQLAHAMLASRFGGPIKVADEQDALTPNPPVFQVLAQLDEAPPALRETRGRLQIAGEKRSLLLAAGRRLVGAVIRESGF